MFDDNDAFVRYQTQLYDGKIYVPFCNANAVLIYDYKRNDCEIVVFDDLDNGYSGVWRNGEVFYFSPRKNTGRFMNRKVLYFRRKEQ